MIVLGVRLVATGQTPTEHASPEAARTINFTRHIRPILAGKCFACHGPDGHSRESGLALHRRELATAEAESGEIAIVPGQPEQSELFRRVTSDDEYERMPPPDHDDALDSSQIELIRRWIEQGAEYDVHWAYQPLRRTARPTVHDGQWLVNGVDAYVLHELEANGLARRIGRLTDDTDPPR